MEDAELELLLSGCPQLLDLGCIVSNSENPVVIAARHCPRLLRLRLTIKDEVGLRGDAVALHEADISRSFLPDLIALTLVDCGGELGYHPPCDFSVLRHFTASPHAQLRYVRLVGRGLTAEDVLSLACLPQLSHLYASGEIGGTRRIESWTRRSDGQGSGCSAAAQQATQSAISTHQWSDERCVRALWSHRSALISGKR
jgi:hypothetical protein